MGNVSVWGFVAFHYLKLWDTQPKPIFSNKVSKWITVKAWDHPTPYPPPHPRLRLTLRGEGAATRRLKQRLKNYVSSYHPWLCSLAITNNINAIFVLKKATARTRKKRRKATCKWIQITIASSLSQTFEPQHEKKEKRILLTNWPPSCLSQVAMLKMEGLPSNEERK